MNGMQRIRNAVKNDPPADLSRPKFCDGYIVTGTSKTTGKAITRWCKNDDDAEVFIEAVSTSSLLGDGGCFWSMAYVDGLRAVCAENYYDV